MIEEKRLYKALSSFSNDFIVIGKSRVRAWHAWLIIGLAAGIVAGILFVANKSGEFEVSQADSTIKVSCNSVKSKYRECPQSGTILSARVLSRRSTAPCKEGTSYGIKGKIIWVDKGCRATFELIIASSIPPPTPPASPPSTLNPPTGLNASCSPEGTKATLAWDVVSGASSYHVRINDTTNDSTSCNSGWFCSDPPDKLLDYYSSISYDAKVTPGHAYKWWVHSVNSAGYSAQTEGTFTCAA